MPKLRVCVIFGGRSGEHEVSLVSAASVINALDKDKYEVILAGITKSGRWIAGETALKALKQGLEADRSSALLIPDPHEKSLVGAGVQSNQEASDSTEQIDVVFPVLHGPFGEDGTMQGLLELANLPYVGAGVLGSAVCMDKIVQKMICQQAGIPIADYLWLRFHDWQHESIESANGPQPPALLRNMSRRQMIETIVERLSLPVFVKPANMGSSVGITKAHTEEELEHGVAEAARYDQRIVIEKAVPDAREIEVSVLGNETPEASVCGEILPSNEFYDYDAKYVDGASKLLIPAELPEELAARIRACAIQGFVACNGEGMARVDFLVERNSDRFFLNEINTIPGFTEISMYPKLWEASGLSYPKLLDRLIELALQRHEERNKLQTSFQPKLKWYQ